MGWAIVVLGPVGTLLPATAFASAPGYPGPFAGTVEERASDTPRYQTYPTIEDCTSFYYVHEIVLTYTPSEAELRLTAQGERVTASNGTEVLTTSAHECASFDVVVTGLDVETEAAHTVAVARAEPTTVDRPSLTPG